MLLIGYSYSGSGLYLLHQNIFSLPACMLDITKVHIIFVVSIPLPGFGI